MLGDDAIRQHSLTTLQCAMMSAQRDGLFGRPYQAGKDPPIWSKTRIPYYADCNRTRDTRDCQQISFGKSRGLLLNCRVIYVTHRDRIRSR